MWCLRKICNKINESLFPNKSEEYSSKWLFKRVDFFLDYPKRNISRNSGPLFRTTIQFVGAMHIFLEGCQKCLQYMYENCTLVSALWGSFFLIRHRLFVWHCQFVANLHCKNTESIIFCCIFVVWALSLHTHTHTRTQVHFKMQFIVFS